MYAKIKYSLYYLNSVESQNSKINKHNLKMHYTTFAEQFKYFKGGFLQG